MLAWKPNEPVRPSIPSVHSMARYDTFPFPTSEPDGNAQLRPNRETDLQKDLAALRVHKSSHSTIHPPNYRQSCNASLPVTIGYQHCVMLPSLAMIRNRVCSYIQTKKEPADSPTPPTPPFVTTTARAASADALPC